MSDKKKTVDDLVNNVLASAKVEAAKRPKMTVEDRVAREKQLDQKRFKERYEELTWFCSYCKTVHKPTVREEQISDGRGHVIPKKLIIPVGFCECEESTEARQQAKKAEQDEARARYLGRLNWADFDFYHPQLVAAKETIWNWYQDPQGRALLLAGHPGSGKSHLARCVARAFYPASLFLPETTLLERVKASFDVSHDSAIRQARQIKVLIYDDMGAGHVREESLTWYREKLGQIFERRIEDGLPTLITSNYVLEELRDRLGRRASSRLGGMMRNEKSYIDLFDVPDYRYRKWNN